MRRKIRQLEEDRGAIHYILRIRDTFQHRAILSRMATIADLQSRISSAIAALDGGNYSSAVSLCEGALLMLAVIPDTQFDQNDRIEFDRAGATAAINSVIRRAKSAAAAQNNGGRDQIVRYTRG